MIGEPTQRAPRPVSIGGPCRSPILGLYTNYTINISAKVPFPSVLAGVADVSPLAPARSDHTCHRQPALPASGARFDLHLLRDGPFVSLPTNGLIQLTYSITHRLRAFPDGD